MRIFISVIEFIFDLFVAFITGYKISNRSHRG